MSAPGPPTDIKSAMKSTSAVISWKRPASIGSGLTGYRVIATSSNGGASQTLNVGATTVQAEIENLTRNKKYSFTVTALGSTNSIPSFPTDTKISDALTSSSTEKSFSSDTVAEKAAINIIQFQDQRTLASNTYTKFKSHDEYIRYLKGKTILGYN
jgi:hypothetical protein